MNNVSYHDRPELSSSQVAQFIDDPVAFWHIHKLQDWPKIEPTAAMQFGTKVHSMIEDGGPGEFVEIPSDPLYQRDKSALKRFKSRHPRGTYFYEAGDRDPLIEIWKSLRLNSHCRHWLGQDRKEEVLAWTDERSGLNCRAMLDVISDYPVPCIVDWKTARDISARKFQSECYSRHYDIRLAFYRRGCIANGIGSLPIIAVAIENQGSYRVQPFQLSDEWIEAADGRLSQVLENIVEFDLESDLNRGILEIDAPKWAKYDSEYEVV